MCKRNRSPTIFRTSPLPTSGLPGGSKHGKTSDNQEMPCGRSWGGDKCVADEHLHFNVEVHIDCGSLCQLRDSQARSGRCQGSPSRQRGALGASARAAPLEKRRAARGCLRPIRKPRLLSLEVRLLGSSLLGLGRPPLKLKRLLESSPLTSRFRNSRVKPTRQTTGRILAKATASKVVRQRLINLPMVLGSAWFPEDSRYRSRKEEGESRMAPTWGSEHVIHTREKDSQRWQTTYIPIGPPGTIVLTLMLIECMKLDLHCKASDCR